MKLLVLALSLYCSYGFVHNFLLKSRLHVGGISKSELCGDSTSNVHDYIEILAKRSKLPQGFKVGATRFLFNPLEVAGKTLPMNVSLIVLDQPTESFAALFTSNKVPGGPVVVGKSRMKTAKYLQAVIVNNKISNVSPSGVTDRGAGDSERLCAGVAKHLNLPSNEYVFPSSTGIIGWRLPVDAIENHLSHAVTSLQSDSILPAALGTYVELPATPF